MATGALANNFHEGSRSEYLAQYFFSGFGSSFQVPHQEDYGIDLFCSIGDQIGKLLCIENYFYVQVKSNQNDINYDDEMSCRWIISHRYPLFICIVSKKNNNLSIYSTFRLSQIAHHPKIRAILLKFDDNIGNIVKENDDCFEYYLGKPIIDTKANRINENETMKLYKEIIRSWVIIDQENINRKNDGMNITVFPDKYESNKIPNNSVIKLEGNYKSQNNSGFGKKYYNKLFLYLANEINSAAETNNEEEFRKIIDVVTNIMKGIEIDQYVVNYLYFCAIQAKERLKSSIDISIQIINR
jgi:hypothetical protein